MRISLNQASELLLNNNCVAVPTETVYGLAAILNSEKAVKQIFTLKGRPPNNPLIIHVADISQIYPLIASQPKDLDLLVSYFWPGPMTLVLPINVEAIPAKVRAHLSTAAFRIPNHPIALELLKKTGPLVMPSANLSGSPSATKPEHVENDFGINFPVLDGGTCTYGLESTILTYHNQMWEIIRLGALSQENFEPILGYIPVDNSQTNLTTPLCPGQMYRHYAPKAKLTLITHFDANMNGIVIGFSDRLYPEKLLPFHLGSSDNPQAVAENLYTNLRNLDLDSIEEAFVDYNFPINGLWITIAERLKKASQGKEN